LVLGFVLASASAHMVLLNGRKWLELRDSERKPGILLWRPSATLFRHQAGISCAVSMLIALGCYLLAGNLWVMLNMSAALFLLSQMVVLVVMRHVEETP
ncbi:MAG: hypothetical protein NTU41_10445, partial [Chloroflexi bacterium]|nr:hypothetical protein [Chloroflexota bacterium]